MLGINQSQRRRIHEWRMQEYPSYEHDRNLGVKIIESYAPNGPDNKFLELEVKRMDVVTE